MRRRALLVVSNTDRAARIARTFGLRRDEWKAVGTGDALGGARFDSVVVLLRLEDMMEKTDRKRIKEYVKYLQTKLPPGKIPVIL